jgi:hypothetical protein
VEYWWLAQVARVSDVCDNNFLVKLRELHAKKLLWGSPGRACRP